MAKTESYTTAAIDILKTVAKQKATILVLSQVKVVERDGQKIGQATNIDIVVEARVNDDVVPGLYAIVGKELVKSNMRATLWPEIYTKVIGKKTVSEYDKETKRMVEVETDATIGTDEMTFKADKGSVWIDSDAMARLVTFISKEESRYTLNVALMRGRDNGELPTVCATDGHRLIVQNLHSGEDSLAPGDYLIPRHVLEIALKYGKKGGGALVTVSSDDRWRFRVNAGNATIMSRPMSGQFPNFEAVMPIKAEQQVSVTTAEFLTALKELKPFTNAPSGTLRFTDKGGYFELYSQSDEGYDKTLKVPYLAHRGYQFLNHKALLNEEGAFAAVHMPMRVKTYDKVPVLDEEGNPVLDNKGAPMTKRAPSTGRFGFNINYMIDTAKVANSDRLYIGWKDAECSFLITPTEQPESWAEQPVTAGTGELVAA